MIKKYLINAVAVLALGLVAVSCSKDTDFTDADALKHAESVLGVTIDPNQDWKMTQEVTVNVTVNLSTGEKYEVMVFDKNPFENAGAVYYVKKTVSDATVSSFLISVPSALTELYVSVFDSNKHSYSQRIAINGEYVNAVFGAPMENSYATGYSFTRANSGVNYPYTSDEINANANHWADSLDYYGGWRVPDTLTAGQKERVRKYFQANPNLTYKDPEWRHFFVQQVYKGGTAVGENSPETVTAANSTSVYTSDNMNKLTVGEENYHLNNFNDGTCSTNGSVLDNGYSVNDWNNHHHSDQIMLMVNIDDTSCFGYHNSGADVQRNDKMALVSAAIIDEWAEANGNPGEKVVDKWNRSFMGFDNALKKWDDIILNTYAKINDVPGAPDYVWDGETIMKKGSAPASSPKRAAKRAKAKRADEVTENLWNGNEEKSNGNAIDNISFSDAAKELLVAGNYIGADVSVVTEWYNNEWSYGTYSDWRVTFAGSWGTALGSGEITLSASTTNVEIQLTDDDIATIKNQITLKVLSNANPVIFTHIYIRGTKASGGDDNQGGGDDNQGSGDDNQGGGDDNQGGGDDNPGGGEEDYEYYGSDYILVDGEEIPFVSAEISQYEGETISVSETEMKITVNDKVCVNLPKFKELYDAGYRPYSSSLRDWVRPKKDSNGKIIDGDSYFSDWIVTLCEAQRIVVTEEHNDDPQDPTPSVCSYAFEDSWHADYDMNDVVVKVKQNEADENKIDITLCCTGAAYNLYVYLDEEELFGGREVHAVLGGTAGKFINTGTDLTNDKFQTKDAVTTTVNKPAGSTLGNLKIWIKSPEKNISLATEGQDPHAVVIPYDWKWPTEWTSIKTAYPEFIEFAKDKSKNLNWYDTPSTEPGVIYGK